MFSYAGPRKQNTAYVGARGGMGVRGLMLGREGCILYSYAAVCSAHPSAAKCCLHEQIGRLQ